VAFTRNADQVHLQEVGGVSCELGKDTQHRDQPDLERRWGSQSACMSLRLHHAGHYTAGNDPYEKVACFCRAVLAEVFGGTGEDSCLASRKPAGLAGWTPTILVLLENQSPVSFRKRRSRYPGPIGGLVLAIESVGEAFAADMICRQDKV
jgi:hypothetical protein